MKSIEHIYPSWCVKNDGSQLFKNTVIKYLNDNYYENFSYYNGNSVNFLYGVNKEKKDACSLNISIYSKELTLDEFIKLTKEEMKYFKLNQTVYHPIYGEGKVYSIVDTYMQIKFKSGRERCFDSLDGRENKDEPITLSQNPIPEIVNTPLEDTYIPFTFEDDLLGKILICKNEKEKLIVSVQLSNGIYSGVSFITYQYLLDNYKFVDGKPCGKLAN